MLQASKPTSATTQKDFLPLTGVDHVEFYVGNARQASHFYRTTFGMRLVAYRGPETGWRDSVSYVLEQGSIRFVLTAALRPSHEVAEHVHRHGDGVKRVALAVEHASAAYHELVDRGGRVVEPLENSRFSIAAYGDTILTFVERHGNRFGEAFVRVEHDELCRPTGLTAIDHMVANVGWGEMNHWVEFYRDVLGFKVYQSFDDKDISTEYSALMSKVMSNGNGRVKFPINEPAEGRRRSQIEEYLDFYQGPGIQHIALNTDDIIATAAALRSQGIEFLNVPTAYYENLVSRVGDIDEPIDRLAELGVLADRDEEGYLLQMFTKPVEDRPTLFFEIIERKGSRGFGKGNFKALFEAIEREQYLRGNL